MHISTHPGSKRSKRCYRLQLSEISALISYINVDLLRILSADDQNSTLQSFVMLRTLQSKVSLIKDSASIFSSQMSANTFFPLCNKNLYPRYTCLHEGEKDWASKLAMSSFPKNCRRKPNGRTISNLIVTSNVRQASVNIRQSSEYISIVTSTRASFPLRLAFFRSKSPKKQVN